MRDTFAVALAVFVGAAGAVISALPALAWWRRWKAAAALPGAFLPAVPDIVGFRYERMKMPFGDGFLDSYTGHVGGIGFLLATEVVPHRKLRTFRLRLDAQLDGEPITYERTAIADPAGDDPLARAVAVLRRRHLESEGCIIFEAS